MKTTALAALLGLTAVPAFAQDVAYDLINQSSYTIAEMYTSSASDPEWGADLMADIDLAPGESGTVTIADGGSECIYDLLLLTDTGEELVDQVDICQMASYTVTD